MRILSKVAPTYDDVLLVPQYSDIASRKGLSAQTKLTNKLALQIPIVSANMDTVIESGMAIALSISHPVGDIKSPGLMMTQQGHRHRIFRDELLRRYSIEESSGRAIFARMTPVGSKGSLLHEVEVLQRQTSQVREIWEA